MPGSENILKTTVDTSTQYYVLGSKTIRNIECVITVGHRTRDCNIGRYFVSTALKGVIYSFLGARGQMTGQPGCIHWSENRTILTVHIAATVSQNTWEAAKKDLKFKIASCLMSYAFVERIVCDSYTLLMDSYINKVHLGIKLTSLKN